MTSLIYATFEDQAFVATDTLATSPDGKPKFFTTKAFAVPHLNMLICGTGAAGFAGRWYIEVNDRFTVRGIDNLDYHAPKVLPTLWDKYKAEFSPPEDFTTTIYHFGFSEEDGLIHSYAYRSADNFKSERMEYRVGYKPECTVPENWQFPIDIPRMMDEQRRIQASKPIQERVFIGGEILVHHLEKTGISIYSLGKFDDYDSDLNEMFSNFNPQQT